MLTRSRTTSPRCGCSRAWRATSMSSSRVTGPSAELIRYAHGSTRIGRTCTPCVTPVFPATRGSAHRPRTARIGCPACTNGNYSTSPEEESATARPDRDRLSDSQFWDHSERSAQPMTGCRGSLARRERHDDLAGLGVPLLDACHRLNGLIEREGPVDDGAEVPAVVQSAEVTQL